LFLPNHSENNFKNDLNFKTDKNDKKDKNDLNLKMLKMIKK
jgi:hypothetical protein